MSFREKIARIICPKAFIDLERAYIDIQNMKNDLNLRFATMVTKIDPFELIMREYHGVFSEELTKPEEKLDTRSHMEFIMWAYQQKHDPHFKFLTDWVKNTQGNETLKRAPVTPERILYGRAQISSMVTFTTEVGRLGSLYEQLLEENKQKEFDKTLLTE